jgi:hypothetical protein
VSLGYGEDMMMALAKMVTWWNVNRLNANRLNANFLNANRPNVNWLG